MLLQNLQLVVGKRYESDEQRRIANRPLFSVVLDEFAPFGYRNFPQILQTARGTNTAFLFSMQSLPQLMPVAVGSRGCGLGPKHNNDVANPRRGNGALFLRASAEHQVTRRNLSMERWKFFGLERYEETGRAIDVQARKRARSTSTSRICRKVNGDLMTDDTRALSMSTCTCALQRTSGCPFRAALFPRLKQSRATSVGANLRFKGAELRKRGTRDARTESRNMRLAICRGLLMIVLTNAAPGVPAQTPPRQNSDRETWYEFMLKQFNPGTSTTEPGSRNGVRLFSRRP